jgi:hypothetical protein
MNGARPRSFDDYGHPTFDRASAANDHQAARSSSPDFNPFEGHQAGYRHQSETRGAPGLGGKVSSSPRRASASARHDHAFGVGGEYLNRADKVRKEAHEQPRSETPVMPGPVEARPGASSGVQRPALTGGALKGAFRAAAKTVAQRAENAPKPQKSTRRKGKSDGDRAWRNHHPTTQALAGKGAARGRYISLRSGKPAMPVATAWRESAPTGSTDDFMAAPDFHDAPLNSANPFWPIDTGFGESIDTHFDIQQDRFFPQP